jgi:hypothetical protein
MADLVEQYADLPLGTSVAAVIALAERLDVDEVATLDHAPWSDRGTSARSRCCPDHSTHTSPSAPT